MITRSFMLALVVSLLAGAAFASDQSERLAARGMVEFQAERYATALKLFNQALKADVKDTNALYYRGLTHVRLNQLTPAIRDLRSVMRRQPDFAEAALDLGSALVQSGAAKDAVRWLTQAQRVAELDGQASLFLGLAQMRLGDTAAARQSFARAARDPTVALSARYYEGVADYRDAKLQQAEEQFKYVITASPDSAVGREAAAFLAKLRQTPQGKPYRLYADAGLQYDSNVVLAPSGEVLKTLPSFGRQGDGVAVFSLGGAYTPWHSRHVQLAVGYDFFQSLYFHRTDFDLQDHRPSIQVAASAAGLSFGILGSYDYYRLDDTSFLQDATALPWLTVPEGTFGRTEFFYRMRRRDFLEESFSLRNAFNHSTGVRQIVNLGSTERYVAVGYQFDREDPINGRGDEFAYDGHEANAAVGWVLPAAVTSEIAYGFRSESYAPASRQNGRGILRHDDEHRISLIAEKWLTQHFGVSVGYLGAFNSSTQSTFTYDRHIVSVSVRARY